MAPDTRGRDVRRDEALDNPLGPAKGIALSIPVATVFWGLILWWLW